MKKADQHTVDKVFRELQEYSPELGETQLDDFAVRLDKMRYLQFGWRHFNIHYTVLACCCFMISIYSIVYYLTTPPTEEKVAYKVSFYYSKAGAIENKEAATLTMEEQIKQSKNSKSVAIVTAKSSVLTEDCLRINNNHYPQASDRTMVTNDTLRSQPQVDTTKPKPVVYIRKRDTIITYDTIKIKRRKK